MPERILWLVDDYVMKSELPERLLPITDERTDGRASGASVAEQERSPSF